MSIYPVSPEELQFPQIVVSGKKVAKGHLDQFDFIQKRTALTHPLDVADQKADILIPHCCSGNSCGE